MEQNGTKHTIYQAARALFSERGYYATSVRDIADAVGIKGASMYAHVSGKEELLWDMVMEVADAFRERVVPELEDKSSPVDALRRAIVAHVSVITDNIESATIYFHEWKFLSEERRRKVRQRRDTYEGKFRAVIQRGIRQGAFSVKNAKYASIMLLSSLNAIYTWYRPGGGLKAREVGSMYADFLIAALVNGTPARKEIEQEIVSTKG